MKYIFTIVFLVVTSFCFAQKHDINWLFGYGGWSGDPNFGDVRINFSGDSSTVTKENRSLDFHYTNASISDKNGNLLFYTNGISVANAEHKIMENGLEIVSGEAADEWRERGYEVNQGALILPIPNKKDKYYLFHQKSERISVNGVKLWIPTEVLSATIDMSKNSGLGKVSSKKNTQLTGRFDIGNLTAVKHGNGIDWWLIIGKFDSNKYDRLLITENGIKDMEPLFFGATTEGGLGQAVFSPNGEKYVKNSLTFIGEQGYVDVYDFDRCTGELSNQVSFRYKEIDAISAAGGAAISANSQYLYIIDQRHIYQYDLYASNIKDSEILVAEYDGFRDPFDTFFSYAQLAPDEKIYIRTANGTKYLHVISNPNEKGELCNVQQHSFNLGVFNYTMPNFPNYRLGVLPGSPCDPLSSSIESTLNQKIALYPNPTTGNISLSFKSPLTKSGNFTLYELTGKKIKTYTLTAGQSEFNFEIPVIASGLYFYKIELENVLIKTGKLTLIK